jgi:hypothetical protein
MSSRVLEVELFAEDAAHEAFLRPLLDRIAREEGKVVRPRVRSAVGGHGRAVSEYKLFQRLLQGQPPPDIVLVCIDANCQRPAQARRTIEDATEALIREHLVVACPDPHIERWYMADEGCFAHVVGAAPRIRRRKCDRDYYKTAMAKAIRQAGQPAALGGIEFASEIVVEMDLFRAGSNDRSLKMFVDSLRSKLRL